MLTVLSNLGALAKYAAVLPALLRLLDEVRTATVDRRLSTSEVAAIGRRLVELLERMPR